jgi:hypothetical protein
MSLQETLVKLAADGVLDKALLFCQLITRHVADPDVVFPAPLHVGPTYTLGFTTEESPDCWKLII